jgi:putative ABC transport system permease protein
MSRYAHVSTRAIDAVWQDFRYALRTLVRARAFTAAVIVTLGLGIGANAVMFNVVDRLMFRPLAYLKDPQTVHRIYWQWQERASTVTGTSSPYARYLDLQRWTTSFSEFAGFYERPLAVGEGESARERRVGAVSGSFFAFFDARPVLGRFFSAAEDETPRGADVAVLSYSFWRSEFGGRDVLGELLQVGNVRANIIGVAPEGFNGVNDADPPVVYIPITTYAASTGTSDSTTYFNSYQWGWMNTLVRRRPQTTVQQAEMDASRAFARSWEIAQPDWSSRPPVDRAKPAVAVSSVRLAAGPNPGLESRTALWLTAVAAAVFLIACANVANLFLARALRRRRETSIRLALGVSGLRLAAQSITESLVLAVAGGAAALVTAQLANAAIQQLLIRGLPTGNLLVNDGRTLGVIFALTIVSGVVIGLVPAAVVGRGDLVRTLRGGARGGASEGARARSMLLLIQSSLSVILLVGAALFVRSLDAVKAMPMGYDAGPVLLVNRIHRGPIPDDQAQLAMRTRLVAAARSLATVESAAWISSAPFVSTSSSNLFVPGIGSTEALGRFSFQATMPDYFQTMGTRIIRGRGLTAEDRSGTPAVAVVSTSMANVLWPQEEAIGKCFRMRSETAPCTTVVGVAEDMVQRDLTESERYHYYLSIDQYTRTSGNGMVLKLRGDPAREAESIRRSLQRVMPGASYVVVRPLQDIVDEQQRSWRLGATLFFYFGALALAVAAIGLYGVVGYNVAHRLHELSVRVALGAARADIFTLIVGQGVRFAAAGAVLGLGAAYLASRAIQPLLFRQSATDLVVYLGAAAVMVLVAVLASAVPALTAAHADPNAALRAE